MPSDDQTLFFDNITGLQLDAQKVREARQAELEHIDAHGVWEVVPIDEAWQVTGKKPIGVRWVDIDKGARTGLGNYRSRLVAKEFRLQFATDRGNACPDQFSAE